jgi:L-threonylcarbamoyladenylate synthase
VDPSSPAAVDALFELKGRAADLAIPLIAATRAQVDAWCGLSPLTSRLADAFWPGPLSVICDAPPSVAPAVPAGRGTVAIRVPDHVVARALAAAWGSPLTSTSANRSGQPPVNRAEMLTDWSAGNLLVVDGGPTPGGPPSTIVDARGDQAILVREGAVAWSRVLHSIQR